MHQFIQNLIKKFDEKSNDWKYLRGFEPRRREKVLQKTERRRKEIGEN